MALILGPMQYFARFSLMGELLFYLVTNVSDECFCRIRGGALYDKFYGVAGRTGEHVLKAPEVAAQVPYNQGLAGKFAQSLPEITENS
jgi:hypothetical protein